MTNIVCADCKYRFANSELLEQHLLSNHVTPGEPIPDAPPPPAVTDPDFEATMKLIEADKAKKQAELDRIQTKKSDPKSAPIEKKPLRLEYRFVGNCSCGAEVETLEIDVGSNHFVSAFCLTERKQVRTDEVPLLVNDERIMLPRGSKLKETKHGSIIEIEKKK